MKYNIYVKKVFKTAYAISEFITKCIPESHYCNCSYNEESLCKINKSRIKYNNSSKQFIHGELRLILHTEKEESFIKYKTIETNDYLLDCKNMEINSKSYKIISDMTSYNGIEYNLYLDYVHEETTSNNFEKIKNMINNHNSHSHSLSGLCHILNSNLQSVREYNSKLPFYKKHKKKKFKTTDYDFDREFIDKEYEIY